MDDTRAVSVFQYHRKPKQKKKRTRAWIGLNSLPDDVLIDILSRLTLVEAVRTSVLSRRWRHLWRFTSGSLDFDFYNDIKVQADELMTWVNRAIELHQGTHLDSFIVRFGRGGVYDDTIPRWICFAMQKQVKRFELTLGTDAEFTGIIYGYDDYSELTPEYKCYHHEFPKLKKLLSLKCAFESLRSLKFYCVNITDEVVHYLLASCPYLESLSIALSFSTRNLEIVDPIPNLKTLEISNCSPFESLKVSTASIVSLSLRGQGSKLLFEYIPNLKNLTLVGHCALSFIYEYDKNKHASYSVQLVKLSLRLIASRYVWMNPRNLPLLYSLKRLELFTPCTVGQSLLFFTLLIKAAPVLHEFKIRVSYEYNPYEALTDTWIPFRSISEADAPRFHHENLKLVEMVGYIGCKSEKKFLLHLFKISPSLEKVVIILMNNHFEKNAQLYRLRNERQKTMARTREEAKQRAKRLQSVFPPNTELVVV